MDSLSLYSAVSEALLAFDFFIAGVVWLIECLIELLHVLSDKAISSVEAYNALEAYRILKAYGIDILVWILSMEYMNGLD